MKIEFNHEEENLEKIMSECVITDKDVDATDEEIRTEVANFSKYIQGFDVGVFISFVSILDDREITKVSELVESTVNQLGYEKFIHFSTILNQVAEEFIAIIDIHNKQNAISRFDYLPCSFYAFTLHHIIALWDIFSPNWRIIVLGSVGVCIGGMTWSWIYIRYRNICYLTKRRQNIPECTYMITY